MDQGAMSCFLPPHHPMLSQPAAPVPEEEITSQRIEELIEKMMEIAQRERGLSGQRSLVGLAAPQIGVPERVILVDVDVDLANSFFGVLKAYINPVIVWRSAEENAMRESCYSVDERITGLVSRADRIRVKAFTPLGQPVNEEFSGFTARIFQHEIDHLDGIRYPDRIGEKGVIHWVEKEQIPEYRKNWRSWPHILSWASWLAAKLK